MFGAQEPLRWPFDPSVLAGVILLTGAYLGAITRWRGRFPGSAPVPAARVASFLLAMVTILLALQTPIADLSDKYLFGVHMVEHLLLTMVMPPLLLLGLPGWVLRPVFVRAPILLRVGRVLTNPLVAFAVFNFVFIGYHAPVFYDLSLASQYAHIVAHSLFMATAILTWWPVLSPLPELPALAPPLQMIYLFAQTLPSQLLGAYFTFSDTLFYPAYVAAPRVWSAVTPAVDQQLGGLIMWVIGGTFFLGAFALVFWRWVTVNEAKERRRYRAIGGTG
jgi:putative membrane protein